MVFSDIMLDRLLNNLEIFCDGLVNFFTLAFYYFLILKLMIALVYMKIGSVANVTY